MRKNNYLCNENCLLTIKKISHHITKYFIMKKLFVFLMLAITTVAVSAQTKKVSILGDSYSTFQGMIPEGYAVYYPNNGNDVKEVSQTWWDLYIKAKGYQLETNDSWSGSTICGTGYGRMDSSGNSPIGEYQYADWTKEDCKNFRPALACLLDMLQKRYPKAQIYSLLNSELREPINESMREICKHYNIQLSELHDIDKQNGHPSISGMKSICNQLLEAIK